MNKQQKKALIATVAVVLVGLGILYSALSKMDMTELERVDITVYVDKLSVSDVYKVPDRDFYFFIVWSGKIQEGYYIDFEKEILSLAVIPKAARIGAESIKVRGLVEKGYSTEWYLQTSFEKDGDKVIVNVEDMDVSYNFKTRPLLFSKKLEFIFN